MQPSDPPPRAASDEQRANGKLSQIAPLLALGFAACLLLLLLKLGSEILEGEGGPWDGNLLSALRVAGDPTRPIGPAWLRGAMLNITSLGSGTILTLVVASVAGFLCLARARMTALLIVASAITGSIATALLKDAFGRPRPSVVEQLVNVQSASFPSGHAADSAIVYLTIGALLVRVEHGRALRAYTLTLALLLTLLVGASRVYLGVHWPSDVLAGWLFGVGWALLWWSIATWGVRRTKRVALPNGDRCASYPRDRA